MMSWLQEEIGIPLEPKHSKVVRPVIQTAERRKMELERVRERELERECKRKKEKKETRKMGASVNPQCQDQSIAPLGWQGGAQTRNKCIYMCLCMRARCLLWTSSRRPTSSPRPHVKYAVLLIISIQSLFSSPFWLIHCLPCVHIHAKTRNSQRWSVSMLNKSGCDALHGFLPSQWWDSERWWGEGDKEQRWEEKKAKEREQQRE